MDRAEYWRQAIMAEVTRLSPEELVELYQMVRKFTTAKARRKVPVSGAISHIWVR